MFGVFDRPRRCLTAPLIALAGLVSACSSSDSTPKYVPQLVGGVQQAALIPAGNYSLATVRDRADGNGTGPRILCVAPSPDWATAITTAQKLSGSFELTSGSKGSGDFSNSFAETITAMVGRTAGVVALRDGLYNACQAYANGVIGKDAYALILSQYGNLLVALAGPGADTGGSATKGSSGASGSPSSTGTPGIAVAVSTGPTGSPASSTNAQGGQGGTGNQGTAGSTALGQMQLQVVQGMLVACIGNQDRSVRNDSDDNYLLKGVCNDFMRNVAAAVPRLLGPSASSGSSVQKPASDDIVRQVQAFLKSQDCDGCKELVVDGIDGPKTQGAREDFESRGGKIILSPTKKKPLAPE